MDEMGCPRQHTKLAWLFLEVTLLAYGTDDEPTPKGARGNRVQTMPGKSYIAWIRLYGPLEHWFDKSWKPGDFELMK